MVPRRLKVRVIAKGAGFDGLPPNTIGYRVKVVDANAPKELGVGRSTGEKKLADHVLSDFNKEDEPILTNVFKNSSILIREFIIGGTGKMLEANSKLYNEEEENIN